MFSEIFRLAAGGPSSSARGGASARRVPRGWLRSELTWCAPMSMATPRRRPQPRSWRAARWFDSTRVDVRSAPDVQAVLERWGVPDVLVHTPAVNVRKPMLSISPTGPSR
ncbi:MAG: hypothetical protein ACRDPT_10030 [Streptomycetales bacterium]